MRFFVFFFSEFVLHARFVLIFLLRCYHVAGAVFFFICSAIGCCLALFIFAKMFRQVEMSVWYNLPIFFFLGSFSAKGFSLSVCVSFRRITGRVGLSLFSTNMLFPGINILNLANVYVFLSAFYPHLRLYCLSLVRSFVLSTSFIFHVNYYWRFST